MNKRGGNETARGDWSRAIQLSQWPQPLTVEEEEEEGEEDEEEDEEEEEEE